MYMSKLSEQVAYPIAETKGGRLKGLKKNGTYIFRGVKYADAKRFQPAEPVAPWTGVKEALVYGYTAPELYTNLPNDQFQTPHYYSPQHEDCQYLNIWTQSLDPKAKRPVIVLFHGGGWGGGSSVEQFAYDGEEMSAFGNIVFISIEHRLNVLGGLDLSAYGEKYKASNWCSLSDVITGLQWIRDNIASFGGDPENVTLMGHAGGGPQVMTLLNCSMADGLYHKVALGGAIIHHSHLPEGMTYQQAAQDFAALLLEKLHLSADEVEKLETIPYWFLASAAFEAKKEMEKRLGGPMMFEPNPDGKVLFDFTEEAPLRKETAGIPIISGGDFGDASSNFRKPLGDNLKDTWEEETVWNYLHQMYGDRAGAMAEEFKKAYPDKILADLLFIDRKARPKNLAVIKKQAALGGKAYNWVFALNMPVDGGTVPWHCCDTAYITHNAKYMEATYQPGVSDRIQDALCSAYCSFMENGDPNNELLPDWEPLGEDLIPTMIFNEKIRAGKNHDTVLQKLLEPWYAH